MRMAFLMLSISVISVFAHAGGSDVGNSNGGVQIACKGVDGSGETVFINMQNIRGTGFGEAEGVLTANTSAGLNTITVRAQVMGRVGKVETRNSNYGKDLFIDGENAFLNLDKVGRQEYSGEFCGPRNNVTVAGIKLTSSDCIAVQCMSRGLSTLK